MSPLRKPMWGFAGPLRLDLVPIPPNPKYPNSSLTAQFWVSKDGVRARVGQQFGAANYERTFFELVQSLDVEEPRVVDAWFRMAVARSDSDTPIPNPRYARGPGVLTVLGSALRWIDSLNAWAGAPLGLLPLGCGNYGCAFTVGKSTKKAVKITFDPTEPETWALVQQLQQTDPAVRAGFAQVHKIAHVMEMDRRDNPCNAILRENARSAKMTRAEAGVIHHLNHTAHGLHNLTKGGVTRRVNGYKSHCDYYLDGGTVPRMSGIIRGLRAMAERRFLIPRIGDDGVGIRRRSWGDAKKNQFILIDPGHPPSVPDVPEWPWLPMTKRELAVWYDR